ncbi:hypothetical protein SmJEL517_g03518 [Synchytrium microbalum]|uniref:Methyltransferase type 11 domain-containing protein n=1 Tax=Synchytrium microbalum TaxID=1806994 RepID=A0A507C3K2_9FUNG|nr:uncharacterized protein SmJEL517_g03518 [Synchytrium microbalum]TPX33639.1 hypothetical protein SmJEL517_g03518 [Synchytrium microbalum]
MKLVLRVSTHLKPVLQSSAKNGFPRVIRCLATHSAATPSPSPAQTQSSNQHQYVFDRDVKRKQRNRAALKPESRQVDYLKDEVAKRLAERILDIKRRFPTVLDLGSGPGYLIRYLDKEMTDRVVQIDSAENMLLRDKDVEYEVPTERLVMDEEHMTFPENTFDCVLSSFSLHWINNLPGVFKRVRQALKPDCPFIGAMLGGQTLFELRTALQLAESEKEGGISPHVSPMTDVRDVGGLLSGAGFTLLTVDMDEIQVGYPSIYELMRDLRSMGESNAVASRKPYLRRETIQRASEIYKEMYGNPDGTIPATFNVLYLIGWKPDPKNPIKVKERGSAESSFKDLDTLLDKAGAKIEHDSKDSVFIKPKKE